MDNQLIFNKFIINQSVFLDGWIIREFDGMSYLYPRVKNKKNYRVNFGIDDRFDYLADFIIDNVFWEEFSNLCQNYLEPKSENDIYSPNNPITFESIKDEKFYFYKEKKAKKQIDNILINLFNDFGAIPIPRTEYHGFNSFIDSFIENNNIITTFPRSFNPYEHIVPVGLLAYTLYQLYSDFFLSQEGFAKTYDCEISVNLTYSGKVWTSTLRANSLYEALKLYLINDRASGTFKVRNCEYCKKIFFADRQKKIRCSRTCTNNANAQKHYYKKKGG